MKNKLIITALFIFSFTFFISAQTTNKQLFHLDKAPNDTLHRADIKKTLELKSDSTTIKVTSFNLEVTYTSYTFSENSTNNKLTKNMVDIIKYLKGTNNFFMINKIVTTEGSTTNVSEGFKVYVVD